MLLKLAHQQQKLLKLKGKKKKPQSACQKDNVLWMAYSVWQANTVLRDNGCRDKSHRGDSPPLTLRSNQTGRMWEKSNHLISGGNKSEAPDVTSMLWFKDLPSLCWVICAIVKAFGRYNPTPVIYNAVVASAEWLKRFPILPSLYYNCYCKPLWNIRSYHIEQTLTTEVR